MPSQVLLEVRLPSHTRGGPLTPLTIYSFDQFLKDRAHLWLSLDTNEFDEVERARALKTMPGVDYNPSSTPDTDDEDGRESKIKGRTVEGKPDFGHNMLKYWGFADGCESSFTFIFCHPQTRSLLISSSQT
jgi:hypothetical protein